MKRWNRRTPSSLGISSLCSLTCSCGRHPVDFKFPRSLKSSIRDSMITPLSDIDSNTRQWEKYNYIVLTYRLRVSSINPRKVLLLIMISQRKSSVQIQPKHMTSDNSVDTSAFYGQMNLRYSVRACLELKSVFGIVAGAVRNVRIRPGLTVLVLLIMIRKLSTDNATLHLYLSTSPTRHDTTRHSKGGHETAGKT